MRALRNLLRRQPHIELVYRALRKTLTPRRGARLTPYGFMLAGNDALATGEFEQQEIELLRALLPEHDRVIDIGANIGLYSCVTRQAGKPVLAVEPLAENISLLLENLSINGWNDTEVVTSGLSSRVGIAEIFGGDTGASLIPGWSSRSERSLVRERIPLTTLDLLLGERFSGERLLIKIDVEGAEFDVLSGAAKTLNRATAPTWLVEICLQENFPEGGNPRYVETFEFFFANGYRAAIAGEDQREVTRAEVAEWRRVGKTPTGAYNYFFTRQRSGSLGK